MLTSITVSPRSSGFPHATPFHFEVQGTWRTAPVFTWHFGDGTSVTRGSQASHTYTRAGRFTVTAEGTTLDGGAYVSRTIDVISMVGIWDGVVTGHTGRWPRPITSFRLNIRTEPDRQGHTPQGPSSWIDNAGCTSQFALIRLEPVDQFDGSIESLDCNDGDFRIDGTIASSGDLVSGECGSAGSACRFTMRRR